MPTLCLLLVEGFQTETHGCTPWDRVFCSTRAPEGESSDFPCAVAQSARVVMTTSFCVDPGGP